MTLTSLGGVSNSASVTFTNAKAIISLVNYGRIVGSIDTYQYNLNSSNQTSTNNSNSSTNNSNSNTNNPDYNPRQNQNTSNTRGNRNIISQ